MESTIWRQFYHAFRPGNGPVALYPRYLLLGAGEGNFNRFLKAAQQNEIHCSFLNIWFSYGVIPTVLLLKWLWEKMRKISAVEWIIAGSLIVESFLLVNYRQPFFWMILFIWLYTAEESRKNCFNVVFSAVQMILL